jgi:HSP20 family protein
MERKGSVAEKSNGNKAVATVGRHPLGLFERLEQEMDEMRRQMFGLFPRPIFAGARPAPLLETAWAPTADAYEKDGTFIVKAELPGVKKDDVQITYDDGLLTIEGKREEEKEVKEARYHACERFTGSFQRSFAIPEGIDASKISAEFKDGVLELRVPMPAAPKSQPMTIAVKG